MKEGEGFRTKVLNAEIHDVVGERRWELESSDIVDGGFLIRGGCNGQLEIGMLALGRF
jgi:hypothetical protein